MRKIKSRQITSEHIKKVNKVLGVDQDERNLSDHGYAFYYNQMFIHNLDLCDADRYANLNTILGYDVGIRKFRSIDQWLWKHNYDLMELNGSDTDKVLLQEATRTSKTKALDYSKWRNLSNCHYTYSFYENGEEFK